MRVFPIVVLATAAVTAESIVNGHDSNVPSQPHTHYPDYPVEGIMDNGNIPEISTTFFVGLSIHFFKGKRRS